MGRKIPGRKHRGVRDPEKQRAERFNEIKTKINAPPVNAGNQDIPKSLSRVIELKEKVKDGTIPLKRKRRSKPKGIITTGKHGISVRPGKTLPGEKPTPVFVQNRGESDKTFVYRVNRICESVVREAHFEQKYGVDIKRNQVTGKVEDIVKRPKDELQQYMKQMQNEEKLKGKKKKKKKKADEGPKLTKGQKRKAKLTEKKQRVLENGKDEFATLTDSVGFGEVVHAPPTLVKPRKARADEEVSRPGKRDLLLKSVLSGKAPQTPQKFQNTTQGSQVKKTLHKAIDKKGKRKDLPHAMRRQLDKQQSEIIQAYKELKKQKYTNK